MRAKGAQPGTWWHSCHMHKTNGWIIDLVIAWLIVNSWTGPVGLLLWTPACDSLFECESIVVEATTNKVVQILYRRHLLGIVHPMLSTLHGLFVNYAYNFPIDHGGHKCKLCVPHPKVSLSLYIYI